MYNHRMEDRYNDTYLHICKLGVVFIQYLNFTIFFCTDPLLKSIKMNCVLTCYTIQIVYTNVILWNLIPVTSFVGI